MVLALSETYSWKSCQLEKLLQEEPLSPSSWELPRLAW